MNYAAALTLIWLWLINAKTLREKTDLFTLLIVILFLALFFMLDTGFGFLFHMFV